MNAFFRLSGVFCKENDRNVQGLLLYQLGYSMILSVIQYMRS